jgi:hypothetical protein
MKTKLELSTESAKPTKTKNGIRTKVRAGVTPWTN